MIALFFEVLPKPGQEGTYFEMAAKLKTALDASGGLLFLDRSRSSARPGWFLSHQFWRDERSLDRWRTDPAHRRAQASGRTEILADYRLRVAPVIASVGVDGKTGGDHADDAGRYIVSVLSSVAIPELPGEVFSSVYDTDLVVTVIPVASAADGLKVLDIAKRHAAVRHARLCLISRDYGMFERAEAPKTPRRRR